MTREELKQKLENGTILDEVFETVDGQECVIIKAEEFEASDDIIYIPDLSLNYIITDRTLSKEEIEDVISSCYTGNDFLEICHGNKQMATHLFGYVDWQHPDLDDFLEGYDEDEFKEEYGMDLLQFMGCDETKHVETNMGNMPLEDYYDIVAMQHGYDSYEDMKKDGLSIAPPETMEDNNWFIIHIYKCKNK